MYLCDRVIHLDEKLNITQKLKCLGDPQCFERVLSYHRRYMKELLILTGGGKPLKKMKKSKLKKCDLIGRRLEKSEEMWWYSLGPNQEINLVNL